MNPNKTTITILVLVLIIFSIYIISLKRKEGLTTNEMDAEARNADNSMKKDGKDTWSFFHCTIA